MTELLELFGYKFFQNALLAALLTSIACGILGTYIVSKNMVFVSGGISHASFGGIGIAHFLSINPLFGAATFSIIAALTVQLLSKKTVLKQDSSIGILWSLGTAIGILFISLTPGYAPNLLSYLFGDILTVSQTDLIMMGAIVGGILLMFILLFKEILCISFDEEFAKTRGLPVTLISTILLCLTALAIVISIRVVGIILVIALLTIPQATASLFHKSFKKIMVSSILFSLLGTLSGLILSDRLNIPSGATIIITLIVIFTILNLYKKIKTRHTLLKKISS